MQNRFGKKITLAISFVSLIFSIISTSNACTRVLHIDPKQGVIVGRNMDWFEEMQSKLVVYPRGIARHGYDPKNSLTWVSQYGSVVATAYDAGATDGMNEQGLAAHGLWLASSNYGERDEKIPGLTILLWLQFYLDNFKSVDEAVRYTETNQFQILPFYDPRIGLSVNVHLALEDATGDSAIIEYLDGTPTIYHSRDYTVLTNDPTYNLQLDNLKQYAGFGGNKPLPGTNDATDRFVRAAYHGMKLPVATSPQEAVAGVLSVLQNTTPPFAVSSRSPSLVQRTIWRTMADLTHHVYYFNSTPHFTTVYVELDKFALQPGSPVMKLDLVNRPTLSGDVTNEFEVVK